PNSSSTNRVTIRIPAAVTIAAPIRLITFRVRAMKKFLSTRASPRSAEGAARRIPAGPVIFRGDSPLSQSISRINLLLLRQDPVDERLHVAVRELDVLRMLLAVPVRFLVQELGDGGGIELDVDQVRSLHGGSLGGGFDPGGRNRMAHVALLGHEDGLAVRRS